MLAIYRTINDELVQTTEAEKGSWLDLINPTNEEIQYAAQETGIYEEFLRYPLDDEEIPRVESEDDQIMIIINVPVICHAEVVYETMPLGIILNDDYIVTVCLEDIHLFQEFSSSRMKDMATFKKTRFIFQLLQKKTNLYLKYLRDINRRHEEIERYLEKSMRNQELLHLMNLEKSLVYFTTSLRSNDKVMEKLMRSKSLKMYEEDEDLLEDVMIENKQAIEMADIYSNISSSTMDTFASIISNNLNIVMKFLASITIILSVPTMIASFFGMNVVLPINTTSPFVFFGILFICIIACLGLLWYLTKKRML
ncbi:MAG: magnesium transporter CorA family protein [Clostridia bacterium]|nr:magnesium transporter CorA family protein [Clostridia bacterium]